MVLDKKDYEAKIDDLLSDRAIYQKLKSNPTTRTEKEITKDLRELCRQEYITKEKKDYLTPQFSSPPQLYGLPKVHKQNILLRPIVSTIGSPTYFLANKLAQILSPLSGQTQSFIKNSAHFVEIIQQVILEDQDQMASFDVVSLFTKVSSDGAMKAISSALLEDDSLEERTNIPPTKSAT